MHNINQLLKESLCAKESVWRRILIWVFWSSDTRWVVALTPLSGTWNCCTPGIQKQFSLDTITYENWKLMILSHLYRLFLFKLNSGMLLRTLNRSTVLALSIKRHSKVSNGIRNRPLTIEKTAFHINDIHICIYIHTHLYTDMKLTNVMAFKHTVNDKFDAWVIHTLYDFYRKLWMWYRL